MADAEQSNLTTLTVDLLSAYVANNNVEHSAIPDLIKSTHAALKIVDTDEPPAPEEPEHKPAVSVRKSLGSQTHIISMIDGKPYQTLKRHLSKHDLTPEQYRERYGLPKTYPMVAPVYSASRRAIAERLGLGRRLKGAQDAKAAPAPVIEGSTPKKTAVTAPKKAAAPKTAKPAPAKVSSPEPAAPSTKAPDASHARVKPRARAKAKAAPKAASIDATATPASLNPAAKGKRATPAKSDVTQSPAAAAKPAPRKRRPKSAPAAN